MASRLRRSDDFRVDQLLRPLELSGLRVYRLRMKIVREDKIIERGPFAQSQEWKRIRDEAVAAIRAAEWPVGSGSFTIYPESGKKTGEGNGVKPIKDNVIAMLTGGKPKYGVLSKQRPIIDEWVAEAPWPVGEREKDGGSRPGGMDVTCPRSSDHRLLESAR